MIQKENFTLKTMVTLVFCDNSSKNKQTHMLRVRNFETNMFRFSTASSIVVRSLATWSAFDCQRNVIAIFLFSEFLIYGIPQCPPSATMEVFLFYMWYILIENFDLNFF